MIEFLKRFFKRGVVVYETYGSPKFERRLVNAINKNYKVIWYAFLVGLTAGLLGSAFRWVLSHIEHLRLVFYEQIKHYPWGYPLAAALTVAAIYISVKLVKTFAPEAGGSGIQEIEGALDGVRPLRWKRVIPVKFIGGLFSLGAGLVLGREGPTVQMGAAVGKMIQDLLKKSHRYFNVLVSAGAASGLAAAFNAPLAGVVFIIEELHGHFKYTFISFVAIIIASAISDIVSRILIGPNPVLQVLQYPPPPIPMYWTFVVLGFIFGFLGLAFNQTLLRFLDWFEVINRRTILLSALIVGVIISAVGFVAPQAIGGGYELIRDVMFHPPAVELLVFLFVLRFFLIMISYATGAPGGIFAPLVSLGVLFGTIFGIVVKTLFPHEIPNVGVYAIAGMAGMFAATVRAPLTGIVLAAEMTSDFNIILPLMLTGAIAAVTTSALGNKPIYTLLLERALKKLPLPVEEKIEEEASTYATVSQNSEKR
jgi:CIC family chloride channel protein